MNIGFMGNKLSGGEKKRVQLLNLTSKMTDVIIFDEPSNALDNSAINWFIKFVNMLKEKYGKTVIIITHDIRLKPLADNIIEMNNL